MLPNFFCIGAQKSGTTSIWKILDAHPNICMAKPRETRFFYDDILFEEGLIKYETEYFSHFKGEERIGEKCPEYLYVPKVANRLNKCLGKELRFIVSLRSPAQRAFSHYRHNMNQLRESRSFEQVIAEESSALQQGKFIEPPYGYIGRGYYAQQLKEYFKYFSKDSFLFVEFENDIIKNQVELASKMYEFLNIKNYTPKGLPFKSGHPKLEDLTVRYNKAREFIEIKRIGSSRTFLKLSRKKEAIEEVKIKNPSFELIQFCNSFNSNKPSVNSLSKVEEQRINQQYFLKDIQWLQNNINSDFGKWL